MAGEVPNTAAPARTGSLQQDALPSFGSPLDQRQSEAPAEAGNAPAPGMQASSGPTPKERPPKDSPFFDENGKPVVFGSSAFNRGAGGAAGRNGGAPANPLQQGQQVMQQGQQVLQAPQQVMQQGQQFLQAPQQAMQQAQSMMQGMGGMGGGSSSSSKSGSSGSDDDDKSYEAGENGSVYEPEPEPEPSPGTNPAAR